MKSEAKVKPEPEVKSEGKGAVVKSESGAATSGSSVPMQTRRRLRGTSENKALLAPAWSTRGSGIVAEDQQRKSAASSAAAAAAAAGGSCYFVFLRNRESFFDAYPLHAWFSFTQQLNYRHASGSRQTCLFSILHLHLHEQAMLMPLVFFFHSCENECMYTSIVCIGMVSFHLSIYPMRCDAMRSDAGI